MSIADKLTAIAENVQKVYEAGKAAGGGEVENPYYYARYANETFQSAVFPENYNLVIKAQKPFFSASGMCRSAQNLNSIKLVCEDMGATTKTRFSAFCRECASVKTVDLTEYQRVLGSDFGYCFYLATALESIYGALDMSNVTNATYAFFCGSLVDVEFVPSTISVDVRFNSAKLSDASVDSIIAGLADLTGSAAKTLTLNGVGSKLTDAQKATISAKNWTLAV